MILDLTHSRLDDVPIEELSPQRRQALMFCCDQVVRQLRAIAKQDVQKAIHDAGLPKEWIDFT